MKTYSLERGGFRAVCVERWPRARAERWLDEPRARSESEMREPDGERVFVKHHCRPLLKAVADVVFGRKSPARRAFEIGLTLQDAHVSAVRPLAMIERRAHGESFTILEFIAGLTLRDFLLRELGSNEAEREETKARVFDDVARAIAALHAAKVRQRDLKALNVMVDESSGVPRIVFVDLEGMHSLAHEPSPQLRARDLARLWVSLRTEDLRRAGVGDADWRYLLERYLAHAGDVARRDDVAWWIARTTAWAERKEVRNRRQGRPIA